MRTSDWEGVPARCGILGTGKNKDTAATSEHRRVHAHVHTKPRGTERRAEGSSRAKSQTSLPLKLHQGPRRQGMAVQNTLSAQSQARSSPGRQSGPSEERPQRACPTSAESQVTSGHPAEGRFCCITLLAHNGDLLKTYRPTVTDFYYMPGPS